MNANDGENPFEAFDLDPREGPSGVTERLRDLAEAAPTEAARSRIRAAWEELTLHPRSRLRAALFAHPESRRPLGSPPVRRDLRPDPADVSLATLLPRPSVAAALQAPDMPSAPDPNAFIPALQDDPIFRSPSS